MAHGPTKPDDRIFGMMSLGLAIAGSYSAAHGDIRGEILADFRDYAAETRLTVGVLSLNHRARHFGLSSRRRRPTFRSIAAR